MRRVLRRTESTRPVERRSTPARIAARALSSIRRARQKSHERTLERLLEQHRAELLACRRRLRIEETPEVGDEIDYSVGNAMRAVGAAVAELSSGTVRGIETALRRLANGRFGYCADCSQKIAPARLKVLPFAERCLDCQAVHDNAPSTETPLFSGFQPMTWARS